MSTEVTLEVGGRQLSIKTGHMARQADGAVTVTYGETVVFTAAVVGKSTEMLRDFFPLMVDYRERTYAAGKIPGGFFKREARPSDREVLVCRLTERTLRPLFPKDFRQEVNVTSMVVSADGVNNPDIPGMIAASAALHISCAPFEQPVAAVRIGLVDDAFVVNPTFEQLETSSLDLVVSGTKDNVNMIEAGADVISEERMLEAIKFAHEEIKKIVAIQEELREKCGQAKMVFEAPAKDESIYAKVRELTKGKFAEIHLIEDKIERGVALSTFRDEVLAQFPTEDPDFKVGEVKGAFSQFEQDDVRTLIVHGKKRPDGRDFAEVRDLASEVGVLPRTHGSALFTRGQTQCLAVTTLGTKDDEQKMDALEGQSYKKFYLHYNFPGFSVGEAKPNRGPGRREVGHGALAERALRAVLPTAEEFPYTIRIVADIMESNGSSSMASVCGGSLSMMDAGVPLKAPVAGIAMGLVTEGDTYEVLTDIAGMEDHLGDMDFKVAGPAEGITALQLDLKIKGLPFEIMEKAFKQAKEARLQILDSMNKTIATHREEMSQYAPRIYALKIDTDKIKDIIGPGGKVIRKIVEDTGVKIDIEDDGTVHIASADGESAQKAIDIIHAITEEPEIGTVYDSTVKRIMPFGCFCEILPGREGLVHVSELSNEFVKDVESIVKVGDTLKVKLTEIDNQGRLNLSAKAAMPPAPAVDQPSEEN